MHLALVAPCGILFPDQGSSLGLQHWEHSLSHWTTTEVPESAFKTNLGLTTITNWPYEQN